MERNQLRPRRQRDDAVSAASAGARFGGLIFADKSPRAVTKDKALSIISTTPHLEYVGVFVDHDPVEIIDIVKNLSLRAVQLHGAESNDYISALRIELDNNSCQYCEIWQANAVITEVPLLNGEVNYHILDGKSPGSGQAFNWQLLAESSQDLSKSLLAGGLNNENIVLALTQLTHLDLFGLDLNSGVETSPGIKSDEKLQQVFSCIRNY